MKKSLIALALVVVVGAVAALFHYETPAATFGAVSGPDLNSPYQTINGATSWYYNAKVKARSATLCSFKSPAATTTLRTFGVNLTTSTTSASVVYLAKGATATATTTNFETVSLSANAQATIVASTTGRTNGLPIISPNTYLVVGFNPTGGVATNTAPVGTCTAVLDQI
jgi:hypothetical protein